MSILPADYSLKILSSFDLMSNLRADFLVDCLLELLVVDDGADLTLAVRSPVRSCHLHPGLASVNPESKNNK